MITAAGHAHAILDIVGHPASIAVRVIPVFLTN
jgi:hypothetical protein